MTNTETLEGMLDTIARLDVRDEASIRGAFADPKPVEVKIGARGVGLKLGKATAIYTPANGHIETGAANFGPIAPIAAEFVLGEAVPAGEPVTAAPVEVELPRRKRKENGETSPAA